MAFIGNNRQNLSFINNQQPSRGGQTTTKAGAPAENSTFYLPFVAMPAPSAKPLRGDGFIGGTGGGDAPPTPQSIMRTIQTELKSQMSNVGKGSALARAYISSTGGYSMKPLEQGVKVRKPDDDGYFQALGYES